MLITLFEPKSPFRPAGLVGTKSRLNSRYGKKILFVSQDFHFAIRCRLYIQPPLFELFFSLSTPASVKAHLILGLLDRGNISCPCSMLRLPIALPMTEGGAWAELQRRYLNPINEGAGYPQTRPSNFKEYVTRAFVPQRKEKWRENSTQRTTVVRFENYLLTPKAAKGPEKRTMTKEEYTGHLLVS